MEDVLTLSNESFVWRLQLEHAAVIMETKRVLGVGGQLCAPHHGRGSFCHSFRSLGLISSFSLNSIHASKQKSNLENFMKTF